MRLANHGPVLGSIITTVGLHASGAVTEAVTEQQPTPTGRESGFRAVSGGPEVTSGSVLLVEAYAAIWVIVLAFVLVGWRRMLRLESRLVDLERALAHKAQGPSRSEVEPVQEASR